MTLCLACVQGNPIQGSEHNDNRCISHPVIELPVGGELVDSVTLPIVCITDKVLWICMCFVCFFRIGEDREAGRAITFITSHDKLEIAEHIRWENSWWLGPKLFQVSDLERVKQQTHQLQDDGLFDGDLRVFTNASDAMEHFSSTNSIGSQSQFPTPPPTPPFINPLSSAVVTSDTPTPWRCPLCRQVRGKEDWVTHKDNCVGISSARIPANGHTVNIKAPLGVTPGRRAAWYCRCSVCLQRAIKMGPTVKNPVTYVFDKDVLFIHMSSEGGHWLSEQEWLVSVNHYIPHPPTNTGSGCRDSIALPVPRLRQHCAQDQMWRDSLSTRDVLEYLYDLVLPDSSHTS